MTAGSLGRTDILYNVELTLITIRRCAIGQGGRDFGVDDRLSTLGNAYFNFTPAPAAHFTLVQENELFPIVMATVLYANVLLDNVPTP